MNLQDLFRPGLVRISVAWDVGVESDEVTLVDGLIVAKRMDEAEEVVFDTPTALVVVKKGGIIHGHVSLEDHIVLSIVGRRLDLVQNLLNMAMVYAFQEFVNAEMEGEGNEELLERIEEFLHNQRTDEEDN